MDEKDFFCTRNEAVDLSVSPQPLYAYSSGTHFLTERRECFNHACHYTFSELLWCVEGAGEITFYDRKYEIRENDAFFWLPGETHSLRGTSKRWVSRWIAIDGPLAEAMLLACRFPRHIRTNVPCPEEIFEEIAQNINNKEAYMIGHLAGLVLEIFARLRQNHTLQSGTLVERCIHYIRNHHQKPEFCVDTLCEVFGVARSTLTKAFAEQAKRTPGNYIRDTRYGKALGLLCAAPTLPVQEVARRCGYASYPSFCRLIRRGTGLSPTDYRRKSTGEK